MKTKDDEIKVLNYKTEKHNHENVIKTLEVDNEFNKKKYKSLKKESIVRIGISYNYLHDVILISQHWYSIN